MRELVVIKMKLFEVRLLLPAELAVGRDVAFPPRHIFIRRAMVVCLRALFLEFIQELASVEDCFLPLYFYARGSNVGLRERVLHRQLLE